MFRGEIPERSLYEELQNRFANRNENVVVFHGIDILKINIDKPFKISEKDFVIVSATYRCIMVIEVKKTLGAGDSLQKSIKQLLEAKIDLEAWFGTEGLHHWFYIPVIFTDNINSTISCDICMQFIIKGIIILSIKV